MTPAINAAKKANINYKIHKYDHDSSIHSYGEEAAQKMGVPIHQVFKTLVICLDNKHFAMGLVPVSGRLNLKAVAKALKSKKAVLAEKHDVERLTGYVLGGVSPLGQKKKIKTLIDCSAHNFKTLFISAGRRGLEIEITPENLQTMTDALMLHLTEN